MSGHSIRLRDDPWQRLPWLLPLALLVTALSQMGFLLLLRPPSATPAAPRPVSVQVVELPVTVSPPTARPAAPPVRKPPPTRRPEPSPPRPTPPPVETRIATVPAPPATASPGPLAGSSTQAPVAALPPVRGPEGPPGGTDTMSARAIYKPMPEIPESLRHRTVELVAVARFRVTAGGSAQVELTGPTGDPDLNRVLLETLKRWRFFPAMQAGKPVASTIDIRIPISVK